MATKKPQTPESALADTVVQGAQNPDGSAKLAEIGTAPSPLTSEALAAAAPHPPATNGGAFVPKIAKILTLPLLKMVEGVPIYIKFTAPTFVGKQIKEATNKEPPVMANVINLATGELVQIMLGSVLQGILADEYPNDAYVGKGFVIQLTEKKRGKSGGNYNTYKVAELEL